MSGGMSVLPTGARRAHVVLRKGTGRETSIRPITFNSTLSKRISADVRSRDVDGVGGVGDVRYDDPPTAAADKPTAAPTPAVAKTPAASSHMAGTARSATKGLPTGVLAKARVYEAGAEALVDDDAAAPFARRPALARTPVSRTGGASVLQAGQPSAAPKPSASSSRRSSKAEGAHADTAPLASEQDAAAADGAAAFGGYGKIGGLLLARTPLRPAAAEQPAAQQSGGSRSRSAARSPPLGAATVASLLEEAAAEAAGAARDAEGDAEQLQQQKDGAQPEAPAPAARADMCTQMPTPGAPLALAAEASGAHSPLAAPAFGQGDEAAEGPAADAEAHAPMEEDDDDDGDFGAAGQEEGLPAGQEAAEEEEPQEEQGTEPIMQPPSPHASDQDDDDDERSSDESADEAQEEPPTPTLTADGARPPARMSVDEAEAARAQKQRRIAQRKRRRHADASCIHPSLAELEAKEAAARAAEPAGEGTRHSRRRKIPVLEFWRNERVVYGRRQSAKFAAIIDVQTAPEEAPPVPRKLTAKPHSGQPATKAKGSHKAAAVPTKPAAGSGSATALVVSKGGTSAAPAAGNTSKAVSGYLLFCNERRAALKTAEPQLSFAQVGQRLGELWRGLSKAEQASYTSAGATAGTVAKRPALTERPLAPSSAHGNTTLPAALPAPKAATKGGKAAAVYREDEDEDEEAEVMPLSKRMAVRP